MSPTRPSRTCSCRPSSRPTSARSSRPAARDPADEQPIWAAHVAAVEEESGGRHPVRDGSGPLPRPGPLGPLGRSRSSTGARSRTRSARCSIRSSAFGAGSGSPPAPPPTRSSPRSSPNRARRSSTSPTSTASRRRSNGRRPSPGRRPRSSSITSGIDADEAHLFQRLANRSSTRIRRCGRHRACSPATNEAHPGCGPTASRATCRSSWCASTRSRTSTSFASCSARTSTGG